VRNTGCPLHCWPLLLWLATNVMAVEGQPNDTDKSGEPIISIKTWGLDFGVVPLGLRSDLSFIVINLGTATLEGTASVEAPFNIQSGSEFAIAPGSEQAISVRFQPSVEGAFTGVLRFTGGGGITHPVSGESRVDGGASCHLTNVVIASPLNGSTLFLGQGGGATAFVNTFCKAHTDRVAIRLNGAYVGRIAEPPYTWNLSGLTPGEHFLEAIAFSVPEPGVMQDEVTGISTFFVEDAQGVLERAVNGLPIDPFATLIHDGDSWVTTVDKMDTGERVTVGLTMFSSPSAQERPNTLPVSLTLGASEASDAAVSVTVPRVLLEPGEVGMVLLELAPDLKTLLGSEVVAQGLIEPPEERALAPDAQWVQVSVLASTDQGMSYHSLDPSRLLENPLYLTLTGIDLTDENEPNLLTHPSRIEDTAEGPDLVVLEGAWTEENSFTLEQDGTVTVQIQSLGILGVLITAAKEAQDEGEDLAVEGEREPEEGEADIAGEDNEGGGEGALTQNIGCAQVLGDPVPLCLSDLMLVAALLIASRLRVGRNNPSSKRQRPASTRTR